MDEGLDVNICFFLGIGALIRETYLTLLRSAARIL